MISQWDGDKKANSNSIKNEGQAQVRTMDDTTSTCNQNQMRVQAQPAFHLHFWSCVDQFYQADRLCDLHLLCSDRTVVKCHRLVLAAVSPAIHRSLRSCPPVEAAAEDAAVIHLPDLSSGQVAAAVSAIYSSLANTKVKDDDDDEVMVDLSQHSAVLGVLGVDLRRRPFYYYEEMVHDDNRWAGIQQKQEQVITKVTSLM